MAEETNNEQKQRNPFRKHNYRRHRYTSKPSSEIKIPEERKEETIAEQKEIQEISQQEKELSVTPQQEQKESAAASQKHQHPHQPRKPNFSVVIPLYNEEESLRELTEQLKNTLVKMGGNYELIFIDDGSTDNSFKVLRDIHHRNHRVKVIRFRRNYGKSAALMVGFQKAQGEFIITMDADLQDDPSEIPNLIKEIKSGYDVVSGWKKKRKDPISKTLPSKFFNYVTKVVSGINIHDFNCGLKAYRKEVVKSVNVYGELHRYIPVLAQWLGFRIGEIPVAHRPRKYGKTKFGMGRFFKGFLDLMTVIFTTRYISRPLHLFGGWGLISAFVGCVIGGWLTYEKFFNDIALSNRPLFLVSLIMIIVGVQFISIGLVGEMIAKERKIDKEYSIKEEIW